MTRRSFRLAAFCLSHSLLLSAALLLAPSAFAQNNDEAAGALVTRAMKADLTQAAAAGKANALLSLAEKLCASGCEPKVQGRIHIANGTVLAYAGKSEPATAAFKKALEVDPEAALFEGKDGPQVVQAFENAKGPKEPPPAEEPESEPAPPKDTRAMKEECEAEGAAPNGWTSAKAFCYFAEAVAAEAGQEWRNCADFASRSAEEEPRATTRYLGGQCNERGGRWVEALDDYNVVIAAATKAGKTATAAEARTRAKLLRERVPRLIVRPPAGATDVEAKLDDADVTSKLGGEMWVNPGQHIVTATGKLAGADIKFRQVVTIKQRETKSIDITQGGEGAPLQDQAVMKCMLEAQSKSEIEECLKRGEAGSGLNLLMGVEVSAYHDTDAVDVLTPGITAALESPTGGWGLNASFLVDVVTAASADIVATASPKWTEVRYVPAIGGHKKFGDVDLSLSGNASIEPDYLALGAGAGFSAELNEKMITPSLNYDFGYDIQGRSGTPFSVFSEKINRHGVTGAITFIIDKATIFSPSLVGVFEFGDTSKPYRYIPIFSPGQEVLPGETIESVNAKRLPGRFAERVPDNRQRYAGSGLFAHRFSSATLRLEERLYIDSWGVKASTTDSTIPIDVLEYWRVWPHLRFHIQTGADFYQIAYFAEDGTNGGQVIPLLRTGDRELGPMLSGTAGLGTRLDFGENNNMGVIFTADAIYSRFLDHLFIRQRFGLFGALSFEVLVD